MATPETTEAITLALFGASGRTGRRVIEAAHRRGMGIRGLVRRPGAMDLTGSAVEIVGAPDDPSAVDRTLDGCSAVCSVLGPHPPHTDVFCEASTREILAGMARQGMRRIVCVTGAMVGGYRSNRTWAFHRFANVYQRRQPAPHDDRAAQEALLRASGLDWTLVKPPRLTDAAPPSRLRAGPDVRVGLLSVVSRADLAEFLVGEILQPRFHRQVVFVG